MNAQNDDLLIVGMFEHMKKFSEHWEDKEDQNNFLFIVLIFGSSFQFEVH